MKKTFLLLLISISGITNLHAQDFSGKWVLKQREFLTGKAGIINGIPIEINAIESSDSLVLLRTTQEDNGQVTGMETLYADGKPSTRITINKRKSIASVIWSADKKNFTEQAILSVPSNYDDIDYTRTEVWNFSEDGKTLTIVKTYASKKDENNNWSQKGIYERQ